MSEQLKQEVDTAEIDRLETETDVDSKTIGQDETELPESKLEDESGNEVKAETGMADPTEEEIRAAEIENAKPVKQKAKEKLEAEKKKATQKNFAESIIAYLLKRCEEDQGLAEDVMQEGKTWNKCFNYIVEQARKQSNGRSTAVEDRVVYEWAEDYYHKEEKPESVQKENDKKTTEKKAKSTKKVAKKEEKCSKDKKNTQSTPENNQKTEKAEKKEKPKKKEAAKKPDKPSMDGQMSLFDLL